MESINITIADNHKMFRECLVAQLKKLDYVKGVYQVSNGFELIDCIKKNKPDLILVELKMPELDGIQALEQILGNYPKTKILALTGVNELKWVIHLIRLGVHGYIVKDQGIKDLELAIHEVMTKGYHYCNIAMTAMKYVVKNGFDEEIPQVDIDFSVREKRVLTLICSEHTDKEIAEQLNVSEKTIEKVRQTLREKSGTRNTAGLVKFAIVNNVIIPE